MFSLRLLICLASAVCRSTFTETIHMLTCQIRAHQQNLTAIKGKTPIRLGRVPNQNSTDICENYPYNQTMRPEYYMSNLVFTITESTVEIENTSVYIEF